MTDLLNCPFCGGEAHKGYHSAYSIDSSFDFIGCKDCCCMFMYEEPKWNARTQCMDDSSRAEAIAAWNTRATPDPLSDPRVKALVDAVAGMERESRKFLRTADFHAETCTCYRCEEDRAFAALRAIEEGVE